MFSFEQLWSKLEIRVLVVSSLFLQIFLLAFAGFRKHVISVRWAKTTGFTPLGPLAFVFHLLLWLAYLLADYVATVALAYLRGSEIRKAQETKTNYLLVFWAPFFILHLGGQDTITALSVEDNELWARHLLILISQVALAMYNYFTSNLYVRGLWPPAALMFAVAIFKYSERVLSLQRASMSALRSSMITKPDPGPNYAKFMQEYTSSNAAGLKAEIKVENEKHKEKGDFESLQNKVAEAEPWEEPDYATVVCKAYEFFGTFKRLFVDLILSYKHREDSQKYFVKLNTKNAYKLIEIELSWMYEILHSKGSIIYSYKHYGWISRVITLIIIIIALCLFVRSDHNGYGRFETILTYVLLGGAVGLEIIALVFMLLSFWTYAAMRKSNFLNCLSGRLFSCQERWLRPEKKARWSDKMAQYSLITYSLEDKPSWWKSIMECLGLKNYWDQYRYTTCVTVDFNLKELVFEELKKKMNNIDDTASYRRFTDHRGQWALQRKGYYQEFGWSVEAEFDESILLWHIATDLLFHESQKSEPQPDQKLEHNPEQQQEQNDESQSEQQPEQKSEPQPDQKLEHNPEQQPEQNDESQSEQQPEQKSEPQPDQKLEHNPEQQQEQNDESQSEQQPEQKSEPQPDQKLEHNPEQQPEQGKKKKREISQDISNYMLFLLIVRPFMMPAGIGQIRFGDTCAEAANFLQPLGEIEKRNLKKIIDKKDNVEDDLENGKGGKDNPEKSNVEKDITKKSNAVRRLLEVDTKYDPSLIKGDRSKSVLFRGCKLAHQLKTEFTPKGKSVPDWDNMWRLISVVWVEILCYAASKCSGQFHAKQLSKGGELLTVIWFLMAHLGMGEQYRIEEGHARAKLIVSK
ncbi:uncharacterized protein LOC144545226 [Carex rostrata]